MKSLKKNVLLSLFVIFSVNLNAQVLIALLLGDKLNSDKLDFGLEGGMNWSRTTGFESNDYARFFNLGFYFDIQMKNQWRLYTGVLVKSNVGLDNLTKNDLTALGATSWDSVGNYKQVINQFMVPALIKYNFKNHMYFEAGPQFGLRFKGFVQFDSDNGDIEGRTRENNKDMLQKLDVGLTAGIGYRLFKGQGWTIGAKYYYGFVDAYKNIPGTKSSSINLKVNIPIGKTTKVVVEE